mmetsp:Transcript_4827/g.7016  ORF Transcript_4827/g.7016 Transcript_4827/m.7016 type:complete len:273 (-) Transcript_4827:43-861(-)
MLLTRASVTSLWNRKICSSLVSRAAMSSGSDILASFGSGKTFEGNNVASAMEALAKADAVCFDVDSTVITEEGIDVLAESLGKGDAVAEWTRKAMTGGVKFQDALAARLALIEPSKKAIEDCLVNTPLQLSPGVDTLVTALQKRGTSVYLVSGGFRIMIEPVADVLGVPIGNIYANHILFDDEGLYAGFDKTEPTSASQGKPKALNIIKEAGGYETMIMVGDGATDAEARPPADAFIGFGGVAIREPVKEKACWFVYDFEDMIKVVTDHQKD